MEPSKMYQLWSNSSEKSRIYKHNNAFAQLEKGIKDTSHAEKRTMHESFQIITLKAMFLLLVLSIFFI